MRVILFRHGPAEDRDASRWPDDGERPLSEWGVERTRLAACGLGRFERGIERVLTSPFKRADHTARILSEALELGPPETLDALIPGGSQRKIIEAINSKPRVDTVVLVGHEPDLGSLAAHLAFNASGALPIKKAGACAIGFEGAVRARGGTLEWFVPPRLLCKLNRKKAEP